ncbi:DUF58 domain-containing protein [Hyphobacterium sp. HN65]|uniref:DUF58 domain-containing protein n=1 Tax=Hyphobacterium lacteum TaxID=3116575 RepID=A0ABU7LP47_9PROT|nr:DUF58 domain-containing protein [Hyphobacterium sp. HN65]MEE2525675.1 DUF58 domain-containing protein [Hyphobacterium sp. HN65]
MRPTVRLLWLALTALVITGLMLPASNGGSAMLALPWTGIALMALADLILSFQARPRLLLEGPRQLFCSESRAYTLWFKRPVPAGLVLRFDWPDGLSGPAELSVDSGSEAVEVEVTGAARGDWAFSDIWMSWPSRFGLFDFVPRAKISETLAVMPDIRPVLNGEIDLAVRTSLMGQKSTFAEGEGSEFHQLREYVPGESLRRIDWKRSARQRRMLSKETRAERNHSVIIALDTGYLMREQISGLPKIDHCTNAGLATAWAAAAGGDQVGLFTYDSRPRIWLPPEPGRRAFPKLRRTLASLAYESRESNHTLALATLKAQLKRRSLVIVFSDFVDTTTAELMVEQAGHMAREHLVIFVALRDPDTDALVRNPVTSIEQAATSVAAADLVRERRIVFERLSRLGVLCLDVEPGRLTPKLVSTYLDLKAREAA